MAITCEQCGKVVEKWPSYVAKFEHQFCSQKCKAIWFRGANHPRWNEDGSITSSGYLLKSIPETGERVFVHRLVMEHVLGRRLRPGEVVHHINGDKLDNRPENLQVFASHSEHISLHNVLNRWAKKYDHCQQCGTNERPHGAHGLCRKCYDFIRYRATKSQA